MGQRTARKLALLLAAVGLLLGCGGPSTAPPDYWPTEGWRSSTPEQQGMDSDLLAEMLDTILTQDLAIDSVTVTRHGTMVTDATVLPFWPDSKHLIYSCTKSVVSALIGIAIGQGAIEGVDEPVLDLLPGRTVANLDENKKAMTLEHLLTMSTGLDCTDSYLYRWQGMREMVNTDDWVQYVLDLPMKREPGQRFEYCNGASHLLSAIITEATGKSALDYAREHLFGPLGIHDVEWTASPQGISIGWARIQMKPHDMAKIGHLYLHDGKWDGQQLLPGGWVEASSHKHIVATLQDGYGYQWWVDGSGYYMALGYAGQYIFVIPDKDMVVVFVSDLEEQDVYVPQELLETYIIPAAGTSDPLPENPEGLERLESAAQALRGRP
jgi:CubicO group peptidase (beta-lactamase class C family)